MSEPPFFILLGSGLTTPNGSLGQKDCKLSPSATLGQMKLGSQVFNYFQQNAALRILAWFSIVNIGY